jgi:formate hydrogenlyase subunit 3/multisubunit Na+/H+ antiporter MnhD subunit
MSLNGLDALMDNVFSTTLGPILVLWIGALIFFALDRFLDPQDRGMAETVVLVLALVLTFNARSHIDVPVYFRALTEGEWPGIAPFLIASQTTWLLSLLVLGGGLMASLASLGKSTVGRSGRLATLGAALLFFAAGDWATLAFAWLLVDVSLVSMLNVGCTRRKALEWTAMLSIIGAVLLSAALLLWQQDGASVWVDRGAILPVEVPTAAQLPAHAAGLLALAALLRVMPFPLPTWLAAAEDARAPETRPIARMIVSAIPMLLGAYLWSRLAQWDVMDGVRWTGVLPVWGGVTYLVGAIKAWGVEAPDSLVACMHDYAGATVLLGAGLRMLAPWQVLLGVSSLLGVTTLFVAWTQCQHLRIFDVRSYWRAAPMLLMLLSTAGLPLTVGFPARVAVYWALFAARDWLVLPLVMIGEALFLGALTRILLELEGVPDLGPQATLDPSADHETGEVSQPGATDQGDALAGRMLSLHHKIGLRLWTSHIERWWLQLRRLARRADWQREIGYSAGALLAISIVFLGIGPRRVSGVTLGNWFRLPTLAVWAALLLPVVGAVTLYRSRDRILDMIGEWWPLIRRVLALNGMYRSIEVILRTVGELIWGTTLVIEGAGYMAWVVLACLLVLLFGLSG